MAIPSVCPSVCLSHVCFVSKWLNVLSKFSHRLIGHNSSFSSPRDVALGLLTCKTVSRITYTVLVETLNPAQSKGCCINLTASVLTGCQIQGGSDFRSICGYILENKTVIDRGIFTVEDEYKVVCALSNGAAFHEPQFQGHSIV